jgi:hypothetical protein
VDADLDTLATALYVKIDDSLRADPSLGRWRPAVGICPKLTDAELLTLCVLQALGGFVSDARFLRHARVHLSAAFPYLPAQSGYNKRVRAAIPQLKALIGDPGGRHRLVLRRRLGDGLDAGGVRAFPAHCPPLEVAGFGSYGYCASHSRFF